MLPETQVKEHCAPKGKTHYQPGTDSVRNFPEFCGTDS